MTITNASIASGRLYPVTTVAGKRPDRIDDFTGPDVTFALDVAGVELIIAGAGARQSDNVVRFHQKDGESGKDVRVWCIEIGESGFTAEALSPSAPHA